MVQFVAGLLAALMTLVGSGAPAMGSEQHQTGTEAVVTPAVARQAKPPRALFFGDSYFVGGGCSPERTRGMAYVAGVRLGYRPVVRGAGGTGFVSPNREFGLPAYLTQIRRGALNVARPKLVVISGGSNDLGRPPERVRRNAAKVVSIAQQKYPRALVVLVGPLAPPGVYYRTVPIRDALAEAAAESGVPFIDAIEWMKGRTRWLCDDYVHPTYAGQRQLGRRLANALASLGAQR